MSDERATDAGFTASAAVPVADVKLVLALGSGHGALVQLVGCQASVWMCVASVRLGNSSSPSSAEWFGVTRFSTIRRVGTRLLPKPLPPTPL